MRGNERADAAARWTLSLTLDKFKIPYSHLKPKINKSLHAKWSLRGKSNIHNNHFHIKPTLGEWNPPSRKSRRGQVIISQLHIGDTRLTHSFILKQEQLRCLTCQRPCPVECVLIECKALALIRKRFFKVNILSDLFANIIINDILSFLRETGLYQRIWWIQTI